jgi:hypothetical protein
MEWKPAKPVGKWIKMGAILSMAAVLLQFYLILEYRTVSVLSTIIRFFSFFTILTNILVALCFIFLWAGPFSWCGKFFANNKHTTAVAVNITIVASLTISYCVVYGILRDLAG